MQLRNRKISGSAATPDVKLGIQMKLRKRNKVVYQNKKVKSTWNRILQVKLWRVSPSAYPASRRVQISATAGSSRQLHSSAKTETKQGGPSNSNQPSFITSPGQCSQPAPYSPKTSSQPRSPQFTSEAVLSFPMVSPILKLSARRIVNWENSGPTESLVNAPETILAGQPPPPASPLIVSPASPQEINLNGASGNDANNDLDTLTVDVDESERPSNALPDSPTSPPARIPPDPHRHYFHITSDANGGELTLSDIKTFVERFTNNFEIQENDLGNWRLIDHEHKIVFVGPHHNPNSLASTVASGSQIQDDAQMNPNAESGIETTDVNVHITRENERSDETDDVDLETVSESGDDRQRNNIPDSPTSPLPQTYNRGADNTSENERPFNNIPDSPTSPSAQLPPDPHIHYLRISSDVNGRSLDLPNTRAYVERSSGNYETHNCQLGNWWVIDHANQLIYVGPDYNPEQERPSSSATTVPIRGRTPDPELNPLNSIAENENRRLHNVRTMLLTRYTRSEMNSFRDALKDQLNAVAIRGSVLDGGYIHTNTFHRHASDVFQRLYALAAVLMNQGSLSQAQAISFFETTMRYGQLGVELIRQV